MARSTLLFFAAAAAAALAGLFAWWADSSPGRALGDAPATRGASLPAADANDAPELAAVAPAAGSGRYVAPGPPDAGKLQVDALAEPPEEGTANGDPEEPEGKVVIAMSGIAQLFIDGSPSRSVLNGRVDISTRRAGKLTVPMEGSRFGVTLRLRDDGVYTTMDGEHELGKDPRRIQFDVAAPRADNAPPLLLYNEATGAPWRYGPSIPFGARDAVIPVCEAPVLELEVLDRVTGRHLDRVNVLAENKSWSGQAGAEHPGVKRLAWMDSSPLRLSPGAPLSHNTSVDLTVEAVGYGTGRITVDFTRPGRRVIELEQAGNLDLELRGDVPVDASVHLRGGGDHSTRAVDGSRLSYRGLVPGEYTARVVLGEILEEHTVTVATASVSVVAGKTAKALLHVPDQEPVPRAALRGTLVIPEAWMPLSRRLSGQLISERRAPGPLRIESRDHQLHPAPGLPGEFAFQFLDLEAGRYVFTLASLAYPFVVDLPPGGINDARWELPPPVEVDVTVKAEHSPTQPSIANVSWHPVQPDGVSSISPITAHVSRETGVAHLRVPACPIEVNAGLDSQVFTAVDGLQVTLRSDPPIAAFVELKDGDKRLPWPAGAGIRVKGDDGERISYGRSFGVLGEPRIHFTVSAPGAYSIEIPKVDGYLPHGDVEVQLTHGPKQTIAVQLTPR